MKRIIKGVLAAALVTTALTAGTISFAANTEVSAIEGVTATLTGSLDDSNFAYYGVGKTNKNIESTTANISSDGEYVISWTVSGNASTVDYLYLDLNFPSPINTQPIKDTFPDLVWVMILLQHQLQQQQCPYKRHRFRQQWQPRCP